MKKKLPSENRSNFLVTYPLVLCFGERLAMVCPIFFKPTNIANGHQMPENELNARGGHDFAPS